MAKVDIDVVILSLDRPQETAAAVGSAVSQIGVRVHVVVVDQGSRPENIESIRGYCKELGNQVTLVEAGRNLGVPGGRDLGIRAGSARVVFCMDNDATFANTRVLERVVHLMDAEPNLGAVALRVLERDSDSTDELTWVFPGRSDREEADVTRFVGCAHAIRRLAYEAAGGYDQTLFFYWEELDLSYRLINRGFRIRYVPSLRVRHWVSPEARVEWNRDRYRRMVCNGIRVRARYTGIFRALIVYGVGYLIRGARNGLFGQAVGGLRDAIGALFNPAEMRRFESLSVDARRYIRDNDIRHRGRLVMRMRREVWARLPGR